MIDNLTLIIPAIISILFLIMAIMVSEKNIKEILKCIGLSLGIFLTFSVISFILGFVAKIIILCSANTEFVQIKEQPIYCLTDSSPINGSKFLFSGTINEKLKYRMFIEQDNGKILKEVDAKEVVIFEDGEKKLVTLEKKFTNEKVIKWIGYEGTGYTTYQIHIPKDSITTEFNIDLNN